MGIPFLQAKMATAGPLKTAFYQAFFDIWFPVFLVMVKLPALIKLLSWFFMRLFALLKPNYFRAIESNYRVIIPNQTDRYYRRLSLKMMDNHSRYWIEFFRYAKLPPERIWDHIVNHESYYRVFEQIGDQGAIMITGHMGNWELGGLFVSQIGRPTHIVYVRDRFNVVERFRSHFRGFGRVNEIPVDRSLFSALPALRALDQGDLLALQGDRDFNDKGVTSTFFGHTCSFPEGPYQLALMARVPVIPVFFVFDKKPGTYRIVSYPALEVTRKGTRQERVKHLLDQYLGCLEDAIRKYPDQWYAFYPFFEDTQASRETVTAPAG